jgi:putative transposase
MRKQKEKTPLSLRKETLRQLDETRLEAVRGDTKYRNHALDRWVSEHGWYVIQVRSRPPGSEGFVLLKRRWVVERTFAWLGRCRRLSKDREKSVLSSESFVKLAMIHLMLNRLEPKGVEAEFQYHTAASPVKVPS